MSCRKHKKYFIKTFILTFVTRTLKIRLLHIILLNGNLQAKPSGISQSEFKVDLKINIDRSLLILLKLSTDVRKLSLY